MNERTNQWNERRFRLKFLFIFIRVCLHLFLNQQFLTMLYFISFDVRAQVQLPQLCQSLFQFTVHSSVLGVRDTRQSMAGSRSLHYQFSRFFDFTPNK